jgi:hypothetical protein
MENTETKVCSKCGLEKPLSAFVFRKDRQTYRCHCQECESEYRKIYQQTHREMLSIKKKEYWKQNRDNLLSKKKKYREENREVILDKKKKDYQSLDKKVSMLKRAKSRAVKKGIDFDLTVEDIIIPDICPVLGIPLFMGTKKRHDNSPSLDRIDNSKGYVKGNVRVISWRANHLKSDSNIQELRKVIAYMESAVPGVSHT